MFDEIPGLCKLNDYISEEPWDLSTAQLVLDSTIKQTPDIRRCLKAGECNQFQRVKTAKAIKEAFCTVLMNSGNLVTKHSFSVAQQLVN